MSSAQDLSDILSCVFHQQNATWGVVCQDSSMP